MPRRQMIMPDLGLGEIEVRASLWLVPAGSNVVQGDRLLEVVAGDVTVDLPAPITGKLVQRQAGDDDLLQPGQVLGVIVAEDAADTAAGQDADEDLV